jgi:hypothetical protein
MPALFELHFDHTPEALLVVDNQNGTGLHAGPEPS